jgi:HEPN domain-containing protein
MDEVRQSALEWIAKARRDMEAAKRMIDCADPLLDTGAYHCQQAAEKALKGWLAFHGTGVIKTHDLVHLIRECARMDSGFLELIEMAERRVAPEDRRSGAGEFSRLSTCPRFA